MTRRSLKDLLGLGHPSMDNDEEVREPTEVDLEPMSRDDLANYSTALVRLSIKLAHEDGMHKTVLAATKAIEVANSVMKDIKQERLEEEKLKNGTDGKDARNGAMLIDTCDLLKLMHAAGGTKNTENE